MRIALLAPIQNSLYSRLVAELTAREPGIELAQIVVRTPWTWARIRGELQRDGARLVRKVTNKLVLGEAAYPKDDLETLPAFAQRFGLQGKNLSDVARLHGVPLLTVNDPNEPVCEQVLKAVRPDVIVFTGGGLIRKNILSIPRLGVMNCHSALLPRFRGMDVVEWTILEGAAQDPGLGLTLHFMDSGVDTGPLLAQYRLETRPGDTIASVRRRLEPHMVELVMEGLRGLRDGTITPQSQSAEDGRQYFVMHPRLVEATARRFTAKG